MAKNLKINVKNTQLAKALNLTKVKKVAARKKKAEELETKASAAPEETLTPPIAKTPAPEKLEQAPPPSPTPEEIAPPREEKQAPSPALPPEERKPREPEEEKESGHRSMGTPPPPRAPHYPNRGPSSYPPRQPYGAGPSGGNRPPSSYPPRRPPYSPPSGQQRPNSYGTQQYPNARPSTPGHYQPQSGPPRQPGGYRPPYAGPRPPGQGYPDRRGPSPYPPRPYSPRPPIRPDQRPLPPKEGAVPSSPQKKKVHGQEDVKKVGAKDFREVKIVRKPSQQSFDARDRQGLRADLEEQGWRKRRPSHKHRVQEEEVIRPKSLKVRIPITIKDLASEMKLKSSQLVSKLFMKGVILTLNDFLDDETTIQLLGQDFDCEITIDTREEDRLKITDKTIKFEIQNTPPEELILRPPVVAFMGHVDHGKTSLIDAIRKSKIASGEAGEITQHIGAFKCHTDVGDLTILDTPGHEAFSAMRARGADVTDIVVLVIAGDEGMRTQTIEALEQAQTASVPIVVAINKSDKPNFNADTVYRQLSERNLLPEVWGGQTITINCSAVTGEGIKELLEMLALQAEILELKANPNTRARGTVIESQMHKGFGPVGTILVQNGNS